MRFRPFALWAIAATLWTAPSGAFASSILIPLPSDREDSASRMKTPARDLIYQGRAIDADEASDLANSGFDLSHLDPQVSDIWTPTSMAPSLSPAEEALIDYPAEGSALEFDSDLVGSRFMYRARVLTGTGRAFRLVVSLESHAAMARAGLLRQLGYTVDLPRRYTQLTIRFSSVAARDRFLTSIAGRTETKLKRWLARPTDDKPEITLQDVVLEPGRIITPPYHWGVLLSSPIKERRVLRALILPFVLMQIPESVNEYSWEMGKILSDFVSLTHPDSDQFNETTWDDARWIARRIALLSRDQLRAALRQGQYPEAVESLLLEKLVSRRNDLVKLFALSSELARGQRELPFDTNLNFGSEVKQGKQVREEYPTYAARFTFGDPESPLRRDEVGRYLFMESASTALRALTTKINEVLELQGASDVARKHQEDLKNHFLNHIKNNPTAPYEAPVGSWFGPTAGLSLSANRNVVTGTYYGSDSKIQLVDNIAAQASVGFFMGYDGMPKVIPGVSGNLVVQRNYIHVKPVPSIKDAMDTSWKWLWVPSFMSHLGALLEADKLSDEELGKNLDKFLTELKEGEMLTITDSIGAGVAGTLAIPLSALLSADPIGVTSSFSIGAAGQAMVLRRTTFTRTKDGIQVYLQHAKSGSLTGTFDFNFWLKALRASVTAKTSAAETKAYLLGQKPADAAGQRKLAIALKALLGSNNSELLEDTYSHYLLEHDLPSTAFKARFLRWSWQSVEESHKVRIEPPADPEKRYTPAEKARTLFSHLIMKRSGTSDYSLVSDILSALTEGSALNLESGGDNPANTFLGKSQWTTVSTEAEITKGRESSPVTIIERHYQGWTLSRSRLMDILDEIEGRLASLRLPRPLVNRDEFTDLKQLQMYDVQSSMILYEAGVQRLWELLTAGGKSREEVFATLIDVEGREQFRAWCRGELNRTHFRADSITHWELEEEVTRVMTGQSWIYHCAKPWMAEVISLTREFPHQHQERVKWTTQLIAVLEGAVDLGRLMEWIGMDNLYFQIRVSGFRSGQENANVEYLSSTLGNISAKDSAGVFRELAEKTKLTTYELNARYLSEGN